MSDVNPCISEDLWFKILQELPVKTLGKCRRVCKSWESLIVSPYFMAAHLKHYTQNESNSFLLYRQMSPKFQEYEQYVIFRDSTHGADGGNSILADAYHTSVCPFKTDEWHFCSYFVGSVNGLLCLSNRDTFSGPTSPIMIWNPFVRKYINLPVSMTANSDLGEHRSVLGFGYHGKNNDHRVLKISFSKRKEESMTFIPLVEVYSVQERAWRMVSADYTVGNSIHSVTSWHCFFNGVIHWLTWEYSDYYGLGNWLLMFNVEEEKFEKMQLPDALLNTFDCGLSVYCVFEYQNKLSMSICDYRDDYDYWAMALTSCQVWVKQEYNVCSSWCKVLDVVLDRFLPSNLVKYLGRNGKLFGLYNDSNRKIVLYDPKTGQTEDIGLYVDGATMFCSYTESLALLDQKTDVYTDYELPRLLPKIIRDVRVTCREG